jgi:hypothetical protein
MAFLRFLMLLALVVWIGPPRSSDPERSEWGGIPIAIHSSEAFDFRVYPSKGPLNSLEI